MISFILLWLGSIITFLIGYALGKGKIGKDTYQEIKKELEHKTYKQYTQPSGLVKRPDAQRLRELNNPKEHEEAEAMRELLKDGGLDNIQPLTK